MTTSPTTVKREATRSPVRVGFALLVAFLLGAGVIYAHMSGLLVPFYHALGLHNLAGHGTGHDDTGAAPGGHAGHDEAAIQ